jgi:D,D-heptose 1,7-bisphosphate phosphatase
MGSKAVFLDRDGTIARDVHYCRRPEDFKLFKDVPFSIKMLNENGYKTVLVTNQSGIARGYFTEETLDRIHQKMKDELAAAGATIDAIYYCPHHPDEHCDCRKPKTALFLKAAKELDIDLGHSYMIGDTEKDVYAGKKAGCKTVLVTTGPVTENKAFDKTDHTAESLMAATRWILGRDSR